MSTERFFEAVVKYRKTIIFAFVACAVFGALCRQLVAINYDMNDYLPAESPSTISLEVMKEEFEGGIPNARVMVEDVSIPQALEYKAALEEIPAVTEVTWLDDAADLAVPLETMDPDVTETYYKDGMALFSVVIDEERGLPAVAAIRELIGEENSMTGSYVATAAATESTVTEIRKITVIAVLFVILVLTLTTDSWAEPLLLLAGLGISILINAGSNLIFGEISFVTNAAGTILQLAISLDFFVFLIHRFKECRGQYGSAERDMVQALQKAGVAILSSGLTVMIGFMALAVMRFRIGPDLGLALAKGICISLIAVFTFMPALLVEARGLIERTRHRPFLPDLTGFGRLVRRMMILLVCVFIILPVPAYMAARANDFYYGSSHIFEEGTQFGDDTARIEETFGKGDTYVLLVPKGDFAEETALSAELQALPQVKSILSYVDVAGAEVPVDYLEEGDLALLLSSGYSRMVLSVEAEYEGEETFDLVQTIRSIAAAHYPEGHYLAGEGVSTRDLMETVTDDGERVDLIAIGAVLAVLLLATGSVSLPVLLVLVIETAIWLNYTISYFNGQPVFYIAYLIIGAVQLGATVDYAILLADRYKECRLSYGKGEAVERTVTTVTVPILTSGSALVVCGFLLGAISTHGVLAQLGMFLGKGTLFSLLMVLFVLPGLLYLCDGLIRRSTRGGKSFKKEKEEA
ncbi:MAG: MMPL family transporter [Bacillota bacterium]|nr:MMPL family transporter [Bacillota bacterium]